MPTPGSLNADLAAAAAESSPKPTSPPQDAPRQASMGNPPPLVPPSNEAAARQFVIPSLVALAPGKFRKRITKQQAVWSAYDKPRLPSVTSPKVWTLAAWLVEVGAIEVLADILLQRGQAGATAEDFADKEQDELDEFERVDELISDNMNGLDEKIRARLKDGAIALSDFICPKLLAMIKEESERNAAPPANPPEKFSLNKSFVTASNKSGERLEAYYGGLESRVGSPHADLFAGMLEEHTQRDDSDATFCSIHFDIVTTSSSEWRFVVQPESGEQWGRESAERMPPGVNPRQPLYLDELRMRLRACNDRLGEFDPKVSELEAVAARLSTGPMWIKYACAMRGSGEAYLECKGNTYQTTIHTLNSFITKARKVTRATKVYRGLAGVNPPEWLWKENAHGLYGWIEATFSSASFSKQAVLQRSPPGKSSVLIEIQQGPLECGADTGWLSQYPHEGEVAFSPLTTFEVLSTQVDQTVFVITVRPASNMRSVPIEQTLHQRQKVVLDLCKQIELAMVHCVDKEEGWGLARELHPDGAARSVTLTAFRRMLREICTQPPESYNDNRTLIGSLQAAVKVSDEMGHWVDGIRGLVRYMPFEPGLPRTAEVLLRLTSLSVAHKNLCHHDFLGVCGLLVLNTSLQQIDLLFNDFTVEEAEAFALIARNDKREGRLSLCGLTHRQTELRFTQRALTPADVLLVATDLRTRPTLTRLVLDDNEISAEGMQALCDSLSQQGAALQSLSISHAGLGAGGAEKLSSPLTSKFSSLTDLNLAFNNIGVKGAVALSESLKANISLKFLNLHYNKLEDTGLQSVLGALIANKKSRLATLVLSSNGLTSLGAAALAKALCTRSLKLSKIDLSWNSIGADGGQAFADALSSSLGSLELSLALSACNLDYPTRKALKELTESSQSKLDISGIED